MISVVTYKNVHRLLSSVIMYKYLLTRIIVQGFYSHELSYEYRLSWATLYMPGATFRNAPALIFRR